MEDIGMEDFRQQEMNQIKHQISVQQQNERLIKLKGNKLALTAINDIKNKFKTKNRNF
jgi:hydrogenase maturation factor